MPRRRELVGRQRPIEFQLLGITPATWTPVDSLAVGRLLAWRLAENHQAELVRAALAAKLGADAARQLTGRYPAGRPDDSRQPPVRPRGSERRTRALAAGAPAAGRHRRVAGKPGGSRSGSPGSSGCRWQRQQQQLGAGRRPDEERATDARQRSAPADGVSVRLVRDAPGRRRARRHRRHDSRRAVHCAWPQRGGSRGA